MSFIVSPNQLKPLVKKIQEILSREGIKAKTSTLYEILSQVHRFPTWNHYCAYLNKLESEEIEFPTDENGELICPVLDLYPSHLSFQVPSTSKLSVKSVASSARYLRI